MKDTSNADLTIKATGYQWKWGYEYLAGEGEGIAFLSTLTTPRDQIDDHEGQAVARGENYLMEVDNHVVVPVNKKVRVVTTANDVIHAWMIPAFGVKQDAIPGFVRDTWFKAEKEGIYRGQCAELCGKDHAYMPIVVEVMSEENYSKWVQAKLDEMKAKQDDPTKEWTKEDLVARGEQVYNANYLTHGHGHDHDHAHDHPHGWRRWLYATNHKDIGTMYLIFSFIMLLEGGVLALMLRAELFAPGLQLVQPEFFNQLTTMHGLIMVF
eukprot:gene10105-9914_t